MLRFIEKVKTGVLMSRKADSHQFLKENLKALEQKDRPLKELIEQSGDSLDNIKLLSSKRGSPSLSVEKDDGSRLLLHSLYDPAKEAERFISNFSFENKKYIIVLGLGLGYHLTEVFKRAEPDAHIFLFEPRLDIFKTWIKTFPLQEQLKDFRLHLIIGREDGREDKSLFLERLYATSRQEFLLSHLYLGQFFLVGHPPSLSLSSSLRYLRNAFCVLSFVAGEIILFFKGKLPLDEERLKRIFLFSLFNKFDWLNGLKPDYKPEAFPDNPKKILLIQMDGIGDVLHLLPSIKGLRKKFPKAHLAFLTSVRCKEVVEDTPYLDEVLLFDPRKFDKILEDSKPSEAVSLLYKEAESFLESFKRKGFDLVINLHLGLSSTVLTNYLAPSCSMGLCLNQGGSEIVGRDWMYHKFMVYGRFILTPGKFDIGLSLHQVDRALLALNLEVSGERIEFSPAHDKGPLPLKGEGLIAIHIGAGEPSKIWPPRFFARLIDMLANEGEKAVLLGIASERRLVDIIKRHCHSGFIDLVGKASLSELPSIFDRCKLFIGADSGTSHIASSRDIPLLIIELRRGKSFRPYSERSITLGPKVSCDCQNHITGKACRALEALNPEVVFEAARTILSERGSKGALRKLLKRPGLEKVVIRLQKRLKTSRLLLCYDLDEINVSSFVNLLFASSIINSWQFLDPCSKVRIPTEDALLLAEEVFRIEDIPGLSNIRSNLLSIRSSYAELLGRFDQKDPEEFIKTNPHLYPLQLVEHLWSFRKSKIPLNQIRRDFCLYMINLLNKLLSQVDFSGKRNSHRSKVFTQIFCP